MRKTHFTAEQVAMEVKRIHDKNDPRQAFAILKVELSTNDDFPVLWKTTFSLTLFSQDGSQVIHEYEGVTLTTERKFLREYVLYPVCFETCEIDPNFDMSYAARNLQIDVVLDK